VIAEHSLDGFRQRFAEQHAVTSFIDAESAAAINTIIAPPLSEMWAASGLTAAEFADEVADYWELPRVSLPDMLGCDATLDGFTPRFLRESRILPFRDAEGHRQLALADPSDRAAIRAAELVFGCHGMPLCIGSFEDITTVLEKRLSADGTDDALQSISPSAQSDDDIESLRDLASGAPVVRALNDLFERAVDLRASDIHIEPFRERLVIRMRVDGLLRAAAQLSVSAPALISRVKILAGLNIAERRLPQDGAARIRVSRSELDVRVATMPTQHGESAVIRLLPRDRGLLEMGRLGLGAADEARLRKLLALPHGLIVVTGPTGSGKTTTLATMLSLLNQTTRKILTIEDPIEYEIPGVNQSQVKPSIGLTFASAMRAFVRQDPDVIMVGEIRDAETSHIAIHAALTGHLVLTTLHTETAAAAVPRLLDLGVEAFLLSSTLRAVVAQRLVRVLCDRCKTARTLSAQDLERDPRFAVLGFAAGETLHAAGGCDRCSGTGYRGRHGAFEVLEMSIDMRRLVQPKTDADSLDQAAIRAGMTTMMQDAVVKCRAGTTTVDEVLRATTVR
jgi:general secretion pathway protein E